MVTDKGKLRPAPCCNGKHIVLFKHKHLLYVKKQILNPTILHMVIWYKAKVQVRKAEMNRKSGDIEN